MIKTGRLLCLIVILVTAIGCGRPESGSTPSPDAAPGEVTVSQEGNRVSLSTPDGFTIRYTTDGSLPSADSPAYRDPIAITRVHTLTDHADRIVVNGCQILDGDVPAAMVIRAAAFAPDGTAGPVATQTCFAQKPQLPAVSIIMDSADLLDEETGIMVRGRIFDEWAETPEGRQIRAREEYWNYVANYTQKGRNWERPALLEFYMEDGVIRSNAGIRIQGGMSRSYAQKSFNIYFREEYGGMLQADLFENGTGRLRSVTLRNGGNDTEGLKFRDAWIQEQLSGLNFTTQASRPVLAFINGEYWGIYNLQEKYGSTFLKEHFGADEVIMIKENELEEGKDDGSYRELLAFAGRDLADPAVWDEFQRVMDVSSMADYFAAQIYIGNTDFKMDRNTALWRSVTEGTGDCDGRWRFLMFDTEYSCGLYGHSIASASYPHYMQAVINFPLFAAAMKNPVFQTMYRESLEKVRSRFSPERTQASLQEYLDVWQPCMADYYARFGDTSSKYDTQSITEFFADRYEDLTPCLPSQ